MSRQSTRPTEPADIEHRFLAAIERNGRSMTPNKLREAIWATLTAAEFDRFAKALIRR